MYVRLKGLIEGIKSLKGHIGNRVQVFVKNLRLCIWGHSSVVCCSADGFSLCIIFILTFSPLSCLVSGNISENVPQWKPLKKSESQ